MTMTKTSEKEFREALRRVAQDYPEFAGKFALVKVKKPRSVVPGAKEECIRWGKDPVTGKEDICIEWA